MFEGFELTTIDTGEARIRVRHGGSGPPLLLLHGNPQTHVMWHKIAPRLARGLHRGGGRPARLRRQLEAAVHRRSCAVLEAGDGPRPGRGDASARVRAVLPGRPRPGRALLLPAGARPSRAGAQAGGARHHPDVRGVPAGRHAVRDADLALVLPVPAGRLPGAGDQRGAGRLLRAPADRRSSRRRRGPTTGAATRTRTRSGRSARTTGPASRSTTPTTRRTSASRRSTCPMLVLWGTKGLPPGGDFLEIWRDWCDDVRGRGIDSATSWPRRRRTRPTPSWRRSSRAERTTQ